jgi:hypothetical protein
LSRTRRHRAIVRFALTGCLLASLLACAPEDERVELAAAAENETRPPWPRYAGLPIEPTRGETRIEGARSSVRLPNALQGDLVRHDLVIHNERAEPMRVERVTVCSGCVLDGFTREIGPGGDGRISFVVLTDSRGGETLWSPIVAETDDPDRPRIEVGVEIEVEAFAALDPYRVWLKGRAGEPISETCLVVPNETYPFELQGIELARGRWIEVDWARTTHEGRPAYAITITNTRSRPGPYQDILFLQTGHPRRPELKVRVEGRIEPGA